MPLSLNPPILGGFRLSQTRVLGVVGHVELGLGDGDGMGGFGSAFNEDIASLEEIGTGGGSAAGFAEELAELDVPDNS